MVPKRKPAPQPPLSTPGGPADPNLTRYSLSDTRTPAMDSYPSDIQDPFLQDYPEQRLLSQEDPFQELEASIEGHLSEMDYHSRQSTDYVPYQPGQHLAPIITGETLQLEQDSGVPSSTGSDIYYDSAITPLPSGSIPLATLSNEHLNPIQGYPQSSISSYTRSYEQLSLPAGSEIDHFNHDTEAYASGHYSRVSYRPPRSRSPTPAVDDEDYMIVGNDSVHYTGYAETQHGYDDPMSENKPYYTERGYLPNGDVVVYDPEPETPTSTVYTLPPEEKTQHFGPAPTGRVLRRHKTKRRVHLTNGNLVVDLDVPPKLVLPRRGEPETMKTRYTAVTCDPDDFEKKGFFLRQNESGRRTEVFIVITMFNVSFSKVAFVPFEINVLNCIRRTKFCSAGLCMV